MNQRNDDTLKLFKILGDVHQTKIRKLTELGLYPDFHRVLKEKEINQFNRFQPFIINSLLSSSDIILVNPPGTGMKTSCLLSVYKQIDTLSILISPTKEISLYLYNLFTQFNLDIIIKGSQGQRGVKQMVNIELLIGEQETEFDIKKVKKPLNIIIATPGRLYKIFKVSKFLTRYSELSLYFFEADILFSRAFEDQINGIMEIISEYEEKNSLFVKKIAMASFIPKEILGFIRKNMRSFPHRLEIYNKNKPSKKTKEIVIIENDSKDRKLKEILCELPATYKVIVFCANNQTCKMVFDKLSCFLLKRTPFCYLTSSELKSRLQDLNNFVNLKENAVLVTTGSAINFLNVGHINAIVNYDSPLSREDYYKKAYLLASLRENFKESGNGDEYYIINFLEQANLKGARTLQKSLLNRDNQENIMVGSGKLTSDTQYFKELIKLCDSKHIKYDRLVYYKYKKGYEFSKQEDMEFRKKQKMLFYDERKAAIKGKLNESNSLKIKIKEKSLVDLQIDVLKTALNKAEKKLNDSVVDAKLTMQREYDNGIKRQINTRNIIKNILKEKFNPFEEEDYEVYDTFDPDLYKSAFIGFIDLEECNPSSKWKILNLIGYSRTKHGKEVTVEIKGNFSHTQFNYDSDERMYMLLRSHNKETLEKAIKDYIKKIHELS